MTNGSGSLRVTNTKLDIDGGVAVPAPDDGRGLYVVVYPAMRVGGELVPAQNGPALLARQPRQFVVAYEVERAGLLRCKVHVNVHTRDGSALPALDVQAVSASGSRRTLETIAGSMPSTQRALPADPFGGNAAWTVEVVSTAPRGFAVSVEHPELDDRRVTP